MKTLQSTPVQEGEYKLLVTLEDGQVIHDAMPPGRHGIVFEDEEALLHHFWYMWMEGNYSCDCNKRIFLCRSDDTTDEEEDEALNSPCGDTMKIASLVVTRPDGTSLSLNLEYN